MDVSQTVPSCNIMVTVRHKQCRPDAFLLFDFNLSFTQLMCFPQMAIRSRLCDSTRIGEYHATNVRYTHDLDTHSDSDDEDNNVIFYSPNMVLKDRGPLENV